MWPCKSQLWASTRPGKRELKPLFSFVRRLTATDAVQVTSENPHRLARDIRCTPRPSRGSFRSGREGRSGGRSRHPGPTGPRVASGPRQGTLKVSSRSGRSVSTNQIDPPARGLVETTSGNRPPPHRRDVDFLLLARLYWIAHARRRDLARFDGSRDRASMMFQSCFLAVETKERISAKSIAPCNDRKPPEIFCRSFIMRPSRSA